MAAKQRQTGPAVKALGEYTTIDGAAQALSLTYWGVRGLIVRQGVPTIRVGRSVMVKLADVAAATAREAARERQAEGAQDAAA